MRNDIKRQAAAMTAAAAGGSGAADTAGYDAELDRLYSAIKGRESFSYDPAKDPLYGALRDSYVTAGRAAMRDTMAQSAALTGGYGSSYAQSAGQLQYDNYLRSLSEAMPELYSQAYRRYSDENARLMDEYALLHQRYDDANEREREAYSREQDEYRRAVEEDERAYRRSREEDETAYRRSREGEKDASDKEKAEYDRMQTAYTKLVKLIGTTGYSPTDDELLAAGLTRAQADALIAQYRRDNGLDKPQYGGGGGGGTKKDDRITVIRSEPGRPIGQNLRDILEVYYGGKKKK